MDTPQDGTPDYAAMSDWRMLHECSDDAMKWAQAFCQIARKNNWTLADINEGLMVGWFANAIEHSSDVRWRRSQPATRPVLPAPPQPGGG